MRVVRTKPESGMAFWELGRHVAGVWGYHVTLEGWEEVCVKIDFVRIRIRIYITNVYCKSWMHISQLARGQSMVLIWMPIPISTPFFLPFLLP